MFRFDVSPFSRKPMHAVVVMMAIMMLLSLHAGTGFSQKHTMMSPANQPVSRPTSSSGGTITSSAGGIPPIVGSRQRSLSAADAATHTRSPPHVRHRIALGAPVPSATSHRLGGVGGAGSLLSGGYPAPTLPSLNPTTPPGTPITEGVPVHSIPGCGVLPLPYPGTPSQRASQKKAVEHALEAERSRIKDLEVKEKDMDADDLRIQLKRERKHSTRLAADLAALWSSAVQSQADAEIEDESRMNGLMRRLDMVQREKGRIIVELEREEEMLTNTLQKKLNEVRKEKALLEQQIEREHEEQARLARRLQDAAVSGADDDK